MGRDYSHSGATRGFVEKRGVGVHLIQVAKWLGHSSYVLTLTTYAEYIPAQETQNPLPEPVAPVAEANVVNLFG